MAWCCKEETRRAGPRYSVHVQFAKHGRPNSHNSDHTLHMLCSLLVVCDCQLELGQFAGAKIICTTHSQEPPRLGSNPGCAKSSIDVRNTVCIGIRVSRGAGRCSNRQL